VEGEAILRHLSGFSIALCVEGESISSENLAAKMEKLSVDGNSNFTFIIGSSHGLAENVKNKADFKLSMSKFTFPHQLARVILLEQIYRIFQINSGGKYHK
jgi:23S rRNA (pseudouridine1915-N3)-methyltransferase